MQPSKKIAIVGGGTAGWLAANLMAKQWHDKNIEVNVIEAPDIGTIGVGEGSTPTLKRFFEIMDIPESEWMPACHATYKVNIRFEHWSPESNIESYSHPFISQLDTFSERPFYANCFGRRMGNDVCTSSDRFLFNGWLAKHNLSPVTPNNFPFQIEYGYHFDSACLGRFLQKHAMSLGVRHHALKVQNVELHADGSIARLHTDNEQIIEADFFVDCSGFRSLLLQGALGVKFKDFSNNLFNDSALVIGTKPLQKIPVETVSTALSNGWAWRIPLKNRTGNGYVYSSQHISKDDAEIELRQHLGLLDSDIEARHLKMRVGQVAEHWSKNCIAIGLAQGFIEPLEATALHLTQISVEMFIDNFEKGHFSNQFQNDYNKEMSERFERIRDYIVAHYKLNSRQDSEYWRENRDNMALSESLLLILDTWYKKNDLSKELVRQGINQHFGATSWHCLLAGYGVFPKLNKGATQQTVTPPTDYFEENQIEQLFSGCILNFAPQK
ncbi:MAG: tryptophan halogenase family protein [Aliiglaciecola sp.]|uniref:tryptophan halogenase family protein n=1 Tax=Aliiglaciecola sp. TaxID=1872441 RepID=UPI003299A6D5